MKILIVSQGPVPTSHKTVVEGGGIRSWSMASGLSALGHEVVIAIPTAFRQPDDAIIQLLHYENADALLGELFRFDAVVSSYSAGVTNQLFESAPAGVLKIADAYVPIHVEVSARDFADDLDEVRQFHSDHVSWIKNLKNSDVILVAHEVQATYYTGLLFGLGKLDPTNYRNMPIIKVPFGANPKDAINHRETSEMKPDKTILWWGGFYPWFDFEYLTELAPRLKERGVKLRIAGAINPFVRVPKFASKANAVIRALQKYDNVEFIDWLPYTDRFKAFEGVAGVIALNKFGPETALSWRTRYIDLLEQGMPLLTNGGDPFGDMIVEAGGGIRIDPDPNVSAREIENSIHESVRKKFVTAQTGILKSLSWNNSVIELSTFLNSPRKTLLLRNPDKSLGRPSRRGAPSPTRMMTLFRAFFAHVRAFGLQDTLILTWSFVCERISIFKPRNDKKEKLSGLVFLLHQLDYSGAPLTAIEFMLSRRKLFPKEKITAVIPVRPDPRLVQILSKNNISLVRASRLQKLNLNLVSAAFVNSLATPRSWITSAITRSKDFPDFKTTVFVHENKPELFIDRTFSEILARNHSNSVYYCAPSQQTKSNLLGLLQHLKPEEISVIDLKVQSTAQSDENTKTKNLNLILVGPTNDNRKRQLDVIQSLEIASERIQKAWPKLDISLTLVGVGKDKNGKSIKAISRNPNLKFTLKALGQLPRDETLKAIGEANVVVSLSDNESLGLYIIEAMTAGAIVLRTRVGGAQETLIDGINGLELDGTVEDLAVKLGKLADILMTDKEKFLTMMRQSKKLSSRFVNADYAAFAASIGSP